MKKKKPKEAEVKTQSGLVPMITLKQHTYDRIVRKSGEQYWARRDMVRSLVATGFARIAADEDLQRDGLKPNEYYRRDLRAKK